MKLVSLNLWGGKLFEPLIEFIKTQSADTDIFCFQEVFDTPTDVKESFEYRVNLLNELKNTLPDFDVYFAPVQDNQVLKYNVDFPVSWGTAVFTRKNISVSESGDFFVFREKNSMVNNDTETLPRALQYIRFTTNNQNYTLANLHGLYVRANKGDTETRIKQSKLIKEFLDKSNDKKILIGDFNLIPDTQSLAILEKGMTNLIKKYAIRSTRSSYYTKTDQKFADYTLVSPDINVDKFEVPSIEVSDHLPMILEFS